MKKTVIFLFLILCMTAVNTGCQKKQETDFILENPKEHTDNEKQTEGNKDIKEGKSDSEKEKSTENIFVYVCGAVQKPGVYELLPGQRICDAIAAAGGLSEQAAGDSLNQTDVTGTDNGGSGSGNGAAGAGDCREQSGRTRRYQHGRCVCPDESAGDRPVESRCDHRLPE